MSNEPLIARSALERILARVTPENLPDEADINWGPPVGSELW
jgi:hypothetical protein